MELNKKHKEEEGEAKEKDKKIKKI